MVGKHEEEQKEQLVQDRASHIHTSYAGNQIWPGVLIAHGNYYHILVFFFYHTNWSKTYPFPYSSYIIQNIKYSINEDYKTYFAFLKAYGWELWHKENIHGYRKQSWV